MSSLSNRVDEFSSDFGSQSIGAKPGKPVADIGLRKLLADDTISEYDRITAIRLRTEKMEQKALMEEQKLRLVQQAGGPSKNIDDNIAVNDVFLDSI